MLRYLGESMPLEKVQRLLAQACFSKNMRTFELFWAEAVWKLALSRVAPTAKLGINSRNIYRGDRLRVRGALRAPLTPRRGSR